MESIGTLAGGLAHDLNNLLTPILMGTGLLRQLDLRPEANEVVQNMGESAKRGSELVRQILSFARGMDGDRVCISLDSLVHDIERMIVNTFPKNIQVENTVGKGLWPVLGDPTQLNQVLLNLCVNARDAMPGGGQLRLSARNCEEHSPLGGSLGPHVVLEVSDTGEGMSQEIQERIFEPFFTTKPIGSGTGLGLSTVLGIVRSHRGFINVSSRPGLGTKFEIHLPASQSGVETTAKPDLEPVLPRGNGECILIVDDEQSILAVASEILRSFGYRTLTCEDGNHALTEFQGSSSEIRLVVTDLMMPALDGPTLIRQLRHRNPDLPIVAMSGLLTESSSLPADIRFLSKPFTAKTLLLVVAESLREGHTRVAPVGKGISAR
jgi:CheY-like chemotaxis protein